MAAHAVLSASGSARWMACPPSARLEAKLPDKGSVYAAEGTLSHALAELKATKYFVGMGPEMYDKGLKALQKDELWAPEMQGHTDSYLDYLKGIYLAHKVPPYVALERRVDFSQWVPEGFGTCDCVMVAGETLHVVDFKYGKNVAVYADHNSQLSLYALGAYATYSLLYPIKKVVLHVHQPRISNVTSWEISLEDLLAWGDRVSEVAALAHAGKGDFTAGDHCRFCRMAPTCRALSDYNVQLAGFTAQKPTQLSNAEVGEYLRQGDLVAQWLKDLKEHALKECLVGREVAGYKAVEGRRTRKWTDGDEAFAAIIADGVDEAMLYERKPLTLAQTEKVLGAKAFVAYEPFVKWETGAPTLVPDTDKRPAVTNVAKAADVFDKKETDKND